MKSFILGLVIGIALGGGMAWAAMSITWVNDSGTSMGTSSNPVIVRTN